MKKVLVFLLMFAIIPLAVFALTQDEQKIVNTIKGVHNFIIIIGLIVCAIGFTYGAIKMGSGDELGKKILFGALIAGLLLILSKPIFNVIIDQGKKGQVQNQEIDNIFR